MRLPSAAARDAYLRDWSAKALYEGSEHFLNLSSRELFRQEAPLEVELGPGTGEFLCALAEANPQINFLGIEASRRAAYHAVGLAEAQGLGNILFVRADIKLLYPMIPPKSWNKVYLHFPDPVHRRKDERLRIFDEEFLDVMAKCLQPHGEISVVSDKDDFFLEMLDQVERDGRFGKVHPERYLAGFQPPVKSRFQQAWERKGIVPKRFIVSKIEA